MLNYYIRESSRGAQNRVSSRAERDGMRRPTSSRSRKIALQDVLEGHKKGDWPWESLSR
jgi:hypothetical protein